MIQKTVEKMHTEVKALFMHALNTVDAFGITKRSLKIDRESLIVRDILGRTVAYDLTQFKRVLVLGFGKVADLMAYATEEVLQDRISGGIVITKSGHTIPHLRKISIVEGGHPVPDARSLEGAHHIAELARSAGERDLVICLISGGGSALCTLPCDNITLADLQQTTDQLLKCGANIEEINTVRKHLSQLKGGRLARLVFPATLISLIFSDVIGDRLEAIASGLTVPDETTFKDARAVFEKYHLVDKIPAAVCKHIELGMEGKIEETVGKYDPAFQRVENLIIVNNLTALRAVAEQAAQIGYNSFILSAMIKGDTRNAAKGFAALIRALAETSSSNRKPFCILCGGEMTALVRGTGIGGRNADFCLALAPLIRDMKNVVVLSGGTDGIDGPTDAAGAIIDGSTAHMALSLGLDIDAALAESDSYTLLKKLDALLVTGPTRTNVMDIQIVMIG
jgi:hydroxypyruvate reductase